MKNLILIAIFILSTDLKADPELSDTPAEAEETSGDSGSVTAGANCPGAVSTGFLRVLNSLRLSEQELNSRDSCRRLRQILVDRFTPETDDGARAASYDCDVICNDPEADRRAQEAETQRAQANARAGQPGAPKASNLGGEPSPPAGDDQSVVDHRNEYFNLRDLEGSNSSCSSLLVNGDTANTEPITVSNVEGGTEQKNIFKPIPSVIDLEDPRSFIPHFMVSESLEGVVPDNYASKVTGPSACRIIASGCNVGDSVDSARYNTYTQCVDRAEQKYKRPVLVGLAKSLAIVEAADASTKFEVGDDFGGVPFECRGNRDGLAFDYPKCKSFYGWYVGLEATGTAFRVGNEAAVITSGMRNQTRLQRQVADGNGQDAGLEAARLQSVAAQQAEERNMAFFSAKGAAILAQLRGWPSKENICSSKYCELFTVSGDDRIGRNFFPNAQVKNQIYAQAINAASQVLVASMKAGMHKANARKVQTIKEQMQFADESDEGVMKFCVQFPQDVRCLSPGERRGLGASGTQFGSFQGTNFGLGSLEGEQASDINAGQNFDGNLGAAGASGSVANIGDANKEAAAAKDIFRAPPAARGGGGGGGGAGAGGGGGGGGSAQSGQLSRDEGLNEEKKQNPIEITSKKAAYEGSKGGYNGGGYKASNKKPEPATANPFASMFGKDKGRDPANVAEIDKPASDLFAKISRRYGEVQKRKGLIDVGDEGQSGLR